MFPGIGGKAAEKLWNRYRETSGRPGSKTPVAERLQACAKDVPRKATAAWAQFTPTIAQLEGDEIRGNAAEMIRLVLEAGYEEFLEENYNNHRSRLEDLKQLATFAMQFATVDEFLTQLALLTNVEAEQSAPLEKEDEELRLSTVHQAKGLEFDVVFIIMLCEGLFPSEWSLGTKDGEEEERRLLYVSITRARNELYLTYPLVRAGMGKNKSIMQRPSRFLSEIPTELVEDWNLRPYG